MTRKLAALALTALTVFFAAGIAGANEIPDGTVHVTCTEVTFGWTHFPDTPVVFHITVTQGESVTAASFSTEGAYNGVGHVPVVLTGAGMVVVAFAWTNGETAHEVTAQREVDCTTVTTPPTTAPPPTTVPVTEPPTTVETPTTVAAGLAPPVSVTPQPVVAELANTGVSHLWLDVLGAWLLIGFGLAVWFGSRTRRGES